ALRRALAQHGRRRREGGQAGARRPLRVVRGGHPAAADRGRVGRHLVGGREHREGRTPPRQHTAHLSQNRAQDRDNFPKLVASGWRGGDKKRQVVAILGGDQWGSRVWVIASATMWAMCSSVSE